MEELLLAPLSFGQELDIVDNQHVHVPVPVAELVQGAVFHGFEKVIGEGLAGDVHHQARHRAVELTRASACEVVYWRTLDPSLVDGSRAVRLAAYRDVRDALRAEIDALLGGGAAAP